MRATKETGLPGKNGQPRSQTEAAKLRRKYNQPTRPEQLRKRHISRAGRASSNRISREVIESVRAAVDIAEVAGFYTDLRRAGAEFVGRCPLHGERTASFRVHSAKGAWFCHGCNRGGDIFALVAQTEGLTFSAAVRRVAAIGSVPLKGSPAPATTEQRKRRAVSERRQCQYELVHKFRGWVGRAFQTYHVKRAAVRKRIGWLSEFTNWGTAYPAYERSQWYWRTREQAQVELGWLYDRVAVLDEYLRILTEGTDVERTELLSHVA